MTKRNTGIIVIILGFILLFQGPVEAKFINHFLWRIGGNNLQAGDEKKMARFDLIFVKKSHYDNIHGDSWGAIKAINPNAEIYLVTHAFYVDPKYDSRQLPYLNNMARYNISRGHSMGSLNRDNPELFLLDGNNQRVIWDFDLNNPMYLLDFGSARFQNYAIEATITDNVNQPWTADGVYSDHINAQVVNVHTLPTKYNTDAKWNPAMNSFINAMTKGLAARGQKFGGNRGRTRYEEGVDAWLALDRSANPPELVVEEAAFVVQGSTDVKFLTEEQWERQIYVLSSIKNSKACFQARSYLTGPGDSGTDNFGKNTTFWDALWFAMGSYLIGKNDVQDNSYFRFHYGSYSNIDTYYDEYDKIDLGDAVSDYYSRSYGGTNIYWREYDAGYVIVNPGNKNVSSISLPEPCKQKTHANLNTNLGSLPNVNSISLDAHRAAILYKSNSQGTTPPPPSQPPPPSGNGDAEIWLEAENGDLNGSMQNETDSKASSGEYIWAANGGLAEYSFNVSQSGTYYVWGRVLGTRGSRNSFYISADNGNDVTWSFPVSSSWIWNQAFSVRLGAGQHTIQIMHREYGAQIDKILITNDAGYNPQGIGGNDTSSAELTTTAGIWLEAEDGDLFAPMQRATDADASSGEYISASSGSGGYAEYSLDIAEPGSYFIWGRVLGTSGGRNSFYISSDDDNDEIWHFPVSTNWDWNQAASVYLEAGQHILTIKQREYRAQLDRLVITADSGFVPEDDI